MPTSYEIYQTYLRGPAAVIRLFKQTFGTHTLCGPPDLDQQQRIIDALSDEIGRLKRQVSRLKAALGEARGEVDWLRRRNAELEKLVAKDSHNSSRPPSTDPPWAKRTKSLRRPSGRRPGGQRGHAGHTLRLTQTPQRVVTHRPARCRHCSCPLAGARAAGVERRQVVELMPARLRVIEHRAEVMLVLWAQDEGQLPRGRERDGTVRPPLSWRGRSTFMTISYCPTHARPKP
jgi:hypothetical protein